MISTPLVPQLNKSCHDQKQNQWVMKYDQDEIKLLYVMHQDAMVYMNLVTEVFFANRLRDSPQYNLI